MQTAWLFLAAVTPSILWAFLMRWWDRREPEPRRLILRLFLAGAATALVILLLLALLQVPLVSLGVLPAFSSLSARDGLVALGIAALGIAVAHELPKIGIAWLLVRRAAAFSEAVDGIVYFSAVAWGAVFVENLLLLTSGVVRSAPRDLAFQFVFTSLLVGVSSGVAGLGFGTARFSTNARGRRRAAALGVLAALAVHAAYRLLLFLDAPRIAGALVIAAALMIATRFAPARRARPRRRRTAA